MQRFRLFVLESPFLVSKSSYSTSLSDDSGNLRHPKNQKKRQIFPERALQALIVERFLLQTVRGLLQTAWRILHRFAQRTSQTARRILLQIAQSTFTDCSRILLQIAQRTLFMTASEDSSTDCSEDSSTDCSEDSSTDCSEDSFSTDCSEDSSTDLV